MELDIGDGFEVEGGLGASFGDDYGFTVDEEDTVDSSYDSTDDTGDAVDDLGLDDSTVDDATDAADDFLSEDEGFRRLSELVQPRTVIKRRSTQRLAGMEEENDDEDEEESIVDGEYELRVQTVSQYFMIEGMFEVRSGNKYITYDNINNDIYTWKKYNSSVLFENSHGLLELAFNMSDATLRGTSDHIDLMTEVISRYQVRLDHDKMQLDAYAACMNSTRCSSIINDSKAKIVNDLIDKIFSNYGKKSAS
mmetsp:Transcript_11629/g.17644  ORF Transcript_11629/g.17644 Transcript_11629/m.17644 type:complete len:251 (+) Transcript_11629:690-1442(+)